MVLKFTAKGISEIEAENHNQPFYTLFSPPRMGMLAQFIQKGLGAKTIDEAYEAIDKYFETPDNNLEKLSLDIATALQEAGFFKRGMDIKEEAKKSTDLVKDYIPTPLNQ